MDPRKFSIQCKKIGMTGNNICSNILTYCQTSIHSLSVAIDKVSKLDTEASHFLDIALHILQYRYNVLINFLMYELGKDNNGLDQNIFLKEGRINLISYYLPECSIKIGKENEDEILGGIKKALDDKTDISRIKNNLIYSLAAIIRSEKEIFSTKNSGVVSSNKDDLYTLSTLVYNGAETIYSLIRVSLRIIEAKFMHSDGYYICKRCGFKMLPNDSIKKCKICGKDFSDLCYLPSCYV